MRLVELASRRYNTRQMPLAHSHFSAKETLDMTGGLVARNTISGDRLSICLLLDLGQDADGLLV